MKKRLLVSFGALSLEASSSLAATPSPELTDLIGCGIDFASISQVRTGKASQNLASITGTRPRGTDDPLLQQAALTSDSVLFLSPGADPNAAYVAHAISPFGELTASVRPVEPALYSTPFTPGSVASGAKVPSIPDLVIFVGRPAASSPAPRYQLTRAEFLKANPSTIILAQQAYSFLPPGEADPITQADQNRTDGGSSLFSPPTNVASNADSSAASVDLRAYLKALVADLAVQCRADCLKYESARKAIAAWSAGTDKILTNFNNGYADQVAKFNEAASAGLRDLATANPGYSYSFDLKQDGSHPLVVHETSTGADKSYDVDDIDGTQLPDSLRNQLDNIRKIGVDEQTAYQKASANYNAFGPMPTDLSAAAQFNTSPSSTQFPGDSFHANSPGPPAELRYRGLTGLGVPLSADALAGSLQKCLNRIQNDDADADLAKTMGDALVGIPAEDLAPAKH